MDALRIGIDLGGTRVRLGLVDASGRVVQRAEFPTPSGGAPEALAAELARGLPELLRASGGAGPVQDRAGICLPGIWDRASGIMQRAVNLPRLEGVALPELFARALGRPVALETDVLAAGWAQWRACHPPPGRFVYLSIGTGVGGCVILDSQLVRHTHGGPGHLGHLVVDASSRAPRCACGARGCLEAVVGGKALDRLLARRRAATGPAALADAYTRAAGALAVGVLQIAHLYAPDVVLAGGGVVEGEPGLVDAAAQVLAKLRGSLVPPGLRFERAPLPSADAGVIGAALLP